MSGYDWRTPGSPAGAAQRSRQAESPDMVAVLPGPTAEPGVLL